MTEQEFADKHNEILASIPDTFRGWLSYQVWEDYHAYGYEEILLHLDDYVDGLKKCLEERKTTESSNKIKLGHKETDVNLVLPNGQVIQIQYRLEGPSIDVCLPTECCVTNWQGDDMEPAPAYKKEDCVRLAKQLVIELNPEWVN